MEKVSIFKDFSKAPRISTEKLGYIDALGNFLIDTQAESIYVNVDDRNFFSSYYSK